LLNLCYDVQLKSFSLHLLAIAFFILVPDLRRLANVFIFNRPVPPADAASPLTSRWTKTASLVLKTLLIGYVLISSAVYARSTVRRRGADTAMTSLYGIYQVIVDGRVQVDQRSMNRRPSGSDMSHASGLRLGEPEFAVRAERDARRCTGERREREPGQPALRRHAT